MDNVQKIVEQLDNGAYKSVAYRFKNITWSLLNSAELKDIVAEVNTLHDRLLLKQLWYDKLNTLTEYFNSKERRGSSPLDYENLILPKWFPIECLDGNFIRITDLPERVKKDIKKLTITDTVTLNCARNKLELKDLCHVLEAVQNISISTSANILVNLNFNRNLKGNDIFTRILDVYSVHYLLIQGTYAATMDAVQWYSSLNNNQLGKVIFLDYKPLYTNGMWATLIGRDIKRAQIVVNTHTAYAKEHENAFC